MILERTTSRFIANPRRLFLVDGVGAVLSAFLLGIVLVNWEDLIGIPAHTLYMLAFPPMIFALFDLYSARAHVDKLSGSLKGIATMNSAYCILSIGSAFAHYQTITFWGWAYIIVEVIIVIALSLVELGVAKKIRTEN